MRTASTLALALTTAVVVFSVHRFLSRSGDGGGALGDASEPALRATDPFGIASDAIRVARTLPSSASAEARRTTAVENDVLRITLDTPETYRNTSILMAIRDAGFVCVDIIAADAGSDEVSAWRVVCDGALVYLVGADDGGDLAVEPVFYGDAYRPFDPRSGPSFDQQSPLNRPPMQLIPVEPQ